MRSYRKDKLKADPKVKVEVDVDVRTLISLKALASANNIGVSSLIQQFMHKRYEQKNG